VTGSSISRSKHDPTIHFASAENLAKGGAALDLKFGGTGFTTVARRDGPCRKISSRPYPLANCPSRKALFYFKAGRAFQPQLDLQAESTLRDYHVNAYIYGSVEDPQLSLTSEPAFAAAGNHLFAGHRGNNQRIRSGKRTGRPRRSARLSTTLPQGLQEARWPRKNKVSSKRFDVDVGAIDNRTGRQEISARFKLGENYYLVGDLDVAGDFTGSLEISAALTADSDDEQTGCASIALLCFARCSGPWSRLARQPRVNVFRSFRAISRCNRCHRPNLQSSVHWAADIYTRAIA
jgi:hypothetical protein